MRLCSKRLWPIAATGVALSGATAAIDARAVLPSGVYSVLECEYVGDRENLPGVGGGGSGGARLTRSRLAGAGQTLAEGPPPGNGGPDFAGDTVARQGFELDGGCRCAGDGLPDPFSEGGLLREHFAARGASAVPGVDGLSPDGGPVFENFPSCPDSGQQGYAAELQWTFAISRPVASHLELQVCLDVRGCQEEQDALGQAASVPIRDFADENGPDPPIVARVVHHPGTFLADAGRPASRCACEDETLPWIVEPGSQALAPDPPPWISLRDASDPDAEAGLRDAELSSSIALVGRDCLTLSVASQGRLVPRDFVTLELRVPASTRVRVRAAADAAALCYLGSIPFGQPLSSPSDDPAADCGSSESRGWQGWLRMREWLWPSAASRGGHRCLR
jgi:hypothetical protein